MARAADPLRSERLGSQVANTVKTSSKVISISTTRAWPTEILGFTCGAEEAKVRTHAFCSPQFIFTPEGGRATYRRHSHAPSDRAGRHHVQDPRSGDGTQTLAEHVEDAFGQAQLPGADHCRGHGRVDVAAADVAEALGQGGDGEAEAERDEHQIWGQWLLRLQAPVDRRAQAKKDKDESSQELPWDSSPEFLGPNPLKGYHNAFKFTRGSTPPGGKEIFVVVVVVVVVLKTHVFINERCKLGDYKFSYA